MTPLFNENMTSSEARHILFASVDGKTKEEIAKIKEEYDKIIPTIIENELTKYRGCLTSDRL